MECEVVVTKKGQITVPSKFSAKYRIEEGTRFKVIDIKEGILFKPKKSTVGLADSDGKHAKLEEMKKLLDKLSKKVYGIVFDSYYADEEILRRTREAIRKIREKQVSAIVIHEVYKLALERECI